MCIRPNNINGQDVACSKCWQCRTKQINNHVGKCIAEMETAYRTDIINLTYGRDEQGNSLHKKSTVLHYPDVQKMLKILGRAGHKFSFFCVGEYGSKRGRAHWHLVLFWRKSDVPLPEFEYLNPKFTWDAWTHGFSFIEPANPNDFRYLCKYILKDVNDKTAQSHLSYSRAPSLGSKFLEALAEKYVESGLSPRRRIYKTARDNDHKGLPREYWMTDGQLDHFLNHFEQKWEEYRGGNYPETDLIDEWKDKKAARIAQPLKLDRYYRPATNEVPKTPNGEPLRWDRALGLWYFNHKLNHEYHRIYWTNGRDGKQWRKRIVSVDQALSVGQR